MGQADRLTSLPETVDEVALEDLNKKIVRVKLSFEEGTGGYSDKNRAGFTSPLAEGEEAPDIPF